MKNKNKTYTNMCRLSAYNICTYKYMLTHGKVAFKYVIKKSKGSTNGAHPQVVQR